MLLNSTFLETRNQRLFDSLNIVGKGLGVHVQRMFEISRVLYTGGNVLSSMFGNIDRKLGALYTIMILQIWCQLILH